MDLDDKLCYCFHISKRKIVNFLKREQPKRASQVSECFGAGSGCGWCIPYLVQLHDQIVGEGVVEGEELSDEDYETLRKRYLSELKEGTRERNQLAGASKPQPDSSPGDDDDEDAIHDNFA